MYVCIYVQVSAQTHLEKCFNFIFGNGFGNVEVMHDIRTSHPLHRKLHTYYVQKADRQPYLTIHTHRISHQYKRKKSRGNRKTRILKGEEGGCGQLMSSGECLHAESREDGCSQNNLISWLFSQLGFLHCNSCARAGHSLRRHPCNLVICDNCKPATSSPLKQHNNDFKETPQKCKHEVKSLTHVFHLCFHYKTAFRRFTFTLVGSIHLELTWVDLSLWDGLLWLSGSFGHCPCRYGPMMASRDIVRLMPELSWCSRAFPAVKCRQLFNLNVTSVSILWFFLKAG